MLVERRQRNQMKRILIILSALLALSCQKEQDKDRLESIENRLQATEFHLATISEVEPRLTNMIRMTEEKYDEWANRVESTRERMAELEGRLLAVEQRVEETEHWIREEEKSREQEKIWATPDGTVPEAWKQLSDKCGLAQAGQAQTTLNFLVRVDRYMSEFPVHHAVELADEDPLMCMTSNIAADSVAVKRSYREREMTILKGRDQWLGYRIDRSWTQRPERGECNMACCELSLDGTWSCEWGWDGGRWECEYDVEGWRNYTKRWHRHCAYIPETRDFYTMPYLMQKMVEKKVDTPDKLYCVVDLVWENRIYCLSHTQYPVMQIRLPFDPENPTPKPKIPRFTVIAVSNYDVLYKDEWTSTWVIRGVEMPEFPGQQAGFAIEQLQHPACCPATNPEAVMALLKALTCIPQKRREALLPQLIEQHGFTDELDFETQRMGMESDPAWKERLDAVRNSPCEEPAE